MSSVRDAALYLDQAHRTRARYQNLPGEIAPATLPDAYAVQEALCRSWEGRLGPIAGLKIATTTKVMQALMGIDHPCGGMIFASRVHTSPASIVKSDYGNVRLESERAVRLGRDLPGRDTPYTGADVRDAVSEVMAAFELIEDRFADYKSTKALSLIADNAWNGGIVIGEPIRAGDRNLDGLAGRLIRNGLEVGTGKTDDPLGALAWLANLAIERGRPMEAGMVVITGSVMPPADVTPGERLTFIIDQVGETSATIV
jgi:2-keto-4-pentenoate hydratase